MSREGYSPALLRQIVTQGGRYGYVEATRNLRELTRAEISAQHVRTLSKRIGLEWADRRDREVGAFQRNELERTFRKAPQAAAVMIDDGRLQTRAEPSGPGVEEPQWRAPKYACCLTMPAKEHATDPQPDPPAKFLDRERAPKLIREMQRSHGTLAAVEPKGNDETRKRRKKASCRGARSVRRRKHLVRTAVATMANASAFAYMLAAEVYRRGLDLARYKACVADGLLSNWTLYEEVLRPLGFIAVLDFLHLLTYVYAAAQAAGGSAEERWRRYEKWLRWAWGGQREKLLAALRVEAARVGDPPKGILEGDPRSILQTAVRYVTNNLDKMDYPRYRKLGLPISSAPVESLIKQFNRRVKGTEKFWTPSAAEAVLQIRAAELSEDNRLERYWSAPRPRGRASAA